jgi:hypothetical protein
MRIDAPHPATPAWADVTRTACHRSGRPHSGLAVESAPPDTVGRRDPVGEHRLAGALDVAGGRLREACRAEAADDVDPSEAFSARTAVRTHVPGDVAAVADVLQPSLDGLHCGELPGIALTVTRVPRMELGVAGRRPGRDPRRRSVASGLLPGAHVPGGDPAQAAGCRRDPAQARSPRSPRNRPSSPAATARRRAATWARRRCAGGVIEEISKRALLARLWHPTVMAFAATLFWHGATRVERLPDVRIFDEAGPLGVPGRP